MSNVIEPQFVDQANVKRQFHVWKQLAIQERMPFTYKCVLCGAVTACPTVNDEARIYQPITPEDRALCPFKEIPT